MKCLRWFGIGAGLGVLLGALSASAGTLSPQLKSLAAAYRQSPKAVTSRVADANSGERAQLFAPHVNVAGQVQVYLHYAAGEPPSDAALAAVGASKVRISRSLGVVQAWVPIARLVQSAAIPGIGRVSLPVYGRLVGGARAAAEGCGPVPAGLDINHEAIAALNVAPLHAQGVKGAGVKIGVISNGVTCVASSQSAGYLPDAVWIDPELPGIGDEGTAMLEEAHAMAPDAALGFCGFEADGGFTTVDFVQCLYDLAEWGADVISDDLGFFPAMYNDSVFATDSGGNAIVDFARAWPDVSLTAAAGNDGTDYYEADYKADTTPTSPSGVPISLSPTYTPGGGFSDYEAAGRNYVSAMDFGGALGNPSDAVLSVQIAPGAMLFGDLTWNDPPAGPYDDLDLFLFKADGSLACAPAPDASEWCSSTMDQITYAGQTLPDFPQGLPPFEFLVYRNDTGAWQTLYLAALCYDCGAHGTQPLHMKLYGFANGGANFNYVTDGAVFGHAALDVEIAAAAAYYRGRGSAVMEAFSNSGPFAYNDWSEAVKTRVKPDVTGIDRVTISGAGGFSTPFYGTSAASPNVGSVIALLRSGFPSAEPDAAGWKQLILGTANPDGITGYENVKNAAGVGLVDAGAAASSLGGVSATITSPAESPFEVDPNTVVAFTAACHHFGSETPSYHWSFGGNSGIPDSTELAPAPVEYANGGVYTVTFGCSASGQSATDRLVVKVEAPAVVEDQSFDTGHNRPFGDQLQANRLGGEQIEFVRVEDAAHGTAEVASDGSFNYTPDKGFSGADSFQFRVANGVADSNVATAAISVAAGSPPVAKDGTLATRENETASGTLQASDPDGDALSFAIVDSPDHGEVRLDDASAGTYTYTPAAGYSGSDSFSFKANDGHADSNTATLAVTVTAVKPPSDGGGGGLGWLGLAILFGLASPALLDAMRRR